MRNSQYDHSLPAHEGNLQEVGASSIQTLTFFGLLLVTGSFFKKKSGKLELIQDNKKSIFNFEIWTSVTEVGRRKENIPRFLECAFKTLKQFCEIEIFKSP